MEETSRKNKIQEFTDLFAWQKGHQIVLLVYKLTKKFPKNEEFGLTSQIQRASVSITSNIAEGFGRKGGKEKLQFYRIAHGSLTEVKNLVIILGDIGLISKTEFEELTQKLSETQALLLGLIKSTKA
jgi:four helix bundle protein